MKAGVRWQMTDEFSFEILFQKVWEIEITKYDFEFLLWIIQWFFLEWYDSNRVSVCLAKGIYNRLPLTKCLILDINLSNIAFSLPSEVKYLKSCLQSNFHGIWFYSNEQNFEKSYGESRIRISYQEDNKLMP